MTRLLNGRYELGEVVGSGGMGAVHRATDTRLGRSVAIKLLRGGPLADDHARARMRSEANLAAAIHHPAVAQVFDFDEDQQSPGTTFIVMQFVEGHTLAQLIRQQGQMAPDQVLSVVVQVAEGLQAAHEAGIVHRDLKPANIMLTPGGRVVIVDFGIAHSAGSEPLTETGSLIGTADYMSPEQASGRPATSQSDLYSLGVIAHHCLTGSSPFRRDSHVSTALAHIREEPPALDGSVPTELADLVASLLAKDPSDRPTSAAAVALTAATIGAASTIDLPDTFEITPDDVPSPVRATPGPQTSIEAPARSRRPRAVFAGVGLVALAAAFIGFDELSGSSQVVPDVVGMTVADATDLLSDEGLTARTKVVDVPGTSAGEVVAQSPSANEPEPDDGPVTLSVTSGKVVVDADKLIGSKYSEAAAALKKLGLEVRRTDVPRTTPAGEVVALDTSGRVPDGSTITLSVAAAPAVSQTSSASTGGQKSSGSTKSKGKGKTKAKKNGKK